MHVKDLSEEIKDCFLIQYADDTLHLQTGTVDSLPQLVHLHDTEQALIKITHNFNKDGLLLNSMKTQCIFIGSRALITKIPGNTTISAGEAFIHPSKSVKNLGLHFDHYMSFDVHVTEMNKKVSGTLMYIHRIEDLLSKEATQIAVPTIAPSHIDYAINITSTTNITQLKRVQKLQNFADKVAIGGDSKFDHATRLLNKLQWLPVRQKVIYEQRVTSFKIMNNQLPSWLFCFPQVRNVNSTNTRQERLLHIPRNKTDTGFRSITVRRPKICNNLPSNVKECNSIHDLRLS